MGLLSTPPQLCGATDFLDAKAFSQALSKLVTEGLGVAKMQVLKNIFISALLF